MLKDSIQTLYEHQATINQKIDGQLTALHKQSTGLQLQHLMDQATEEIRKNF